MDLDLLPDGVVVADRDGLIEHLNTSAERLLGVRAAECIGKPVRDVLTLDNRQGSVWFDCVHPYDGLETRTRLTEQSWFTAHGDELLVTARLNRSKPRGPVEHLVIGLRDSKGRARLDRERSDMVATVAHELRSPLTGVKGFTSTLLKKWDRFSDEQRQFMLETVDADADRLTRLITELLDAARIDSGRLTLRIQAVNVGELVERVLSNISAGIGRTLNVTIDAEHATVWADQDRLTQVFTNLIENALNHGEGLRSVTVREPVDGRGGVVVSIEDFGPGIAVEDRTRVFNRFWKGGQGAGSGLGMYIVAGIVDSHQGQVEIGSVADGPGACVTVWLPNNVPAGLAS
ncbi:ATP-binding protein [soil metagenome]